MAKKQKKFPIGTLVEVTIPKMGQKPLKLLGLVISHAKFDGTDKLEVFFGPNEWIRSMETINVPVNKLRSVSRAYWKTGG